MDIIVPYSLWYIFMGEIYSDQYTLSTECEIQMITSQLIFARKNISKALWDNDIHNLQNGRKIVIILHIYWAIAIFLLFYDDQDTLSTECEIYMTISQLIFTNKKYQRLYVTMILTIYKMGERYCGNSSYLYSYSHFPTILWWPRHCIWVMGNKNEHI